MDRTSQAVKSQIAAMGAQIFEVGLFKPAAQEQGQAVMIPRTWDRDTVLRSLPWLRLQNADGRNVYIRPKGEHDLSLVDDLTADAVKRMKATGFSPAVLVETSPGNFQAWLKHPRQLPRDVSTLAARKLAEDFGGDRGAADWRHFGRLSGLTNRKSKYMSEAGLFPYVRLIEASGVPYPAGERFVQAVVAQCDIDRSERRQHRSTHVASSGRTTLKSVDDFRLNPRYGGDATREDLAYAIYALAHGADTGQVSAALKGRDLSHKGDEKRQEQYVERTLSKARDLVEGRSRS